MEYNSETRGIPEWYDIIYMREERRINRWKQISFWRKEMLRVCRLSTMNTQLSFRRTGPKHNREAGQWIFK